MIVLLRKKEGFGIEFEYEFEFEFELAYDDFMFEVIISSNYQIFLFSSKNRTNCLRVPD